VVFILLLKKALGRYVVTDGYILYYLQPNFIISINAKTLLIKDQQGFEKIKVLLLKSAKPHPHIIWREIQTLLPHIFYSIGAI
jgi:hypothetical protein